MSIYEKSLNEYLEEAASASPTPGGGSVSAVVGANAAAMVCMVANLTLGKKKYAEVQEQAERILTDASAAIEKLKKLTEQDMQAFEAVMSALRMPSDTDAEKEVKASAMAQATRTATEVPLEVCSVCLDILKLALELAPIGNKNAISDVGVGAYTAEAALRSALLSVDINFPMIRDEGFRTEVESEKRRLLSESKALCADCLSKVQERMN